MNEGKAPPLRIEIWPTNKCNLRCLFCREILPRTESEIPEKRLICLLKEAAEMGVEECFIGGGGEPFMRKRTTLSLIKLSKQLGLSCFVNTNGTLLLKKDIKKIVDLGLDEIAISISGFGSIHDFLVNKRGAFKRIEKTLLFFNKFKKEKNKDIPRISIWTVLTNKNFNKIRSLIEFTHRYNISTILFFSMRVNFPAAEKLKMKEEEITEFMKIKEDAETLLKKYRINSNLPEFVNKKFIEWSDDVGKILLSSISKKKNFFSIPCYEPWYYVTITPTGKVGPCAALSMKSTISVDSGKMEEIWYSEYFNRIRQQLFSHNISGICEKCCIDKIFESERIRAYLKKQFIKDS
ncbi:MAG: radical SAM protein [Candidatus Aenigmatarchaeota archaeon]